MKNPSKKGVLLNRELFFKYFFVKKEFFKTEKCLNKSFYLNYIINDMLENSQDYMESGMACHVAYQLNTERRLPKSHHAIPGSHAERSFKYPIFCKGVSDPAPHFSDIYHHQDVCPIEACLP